MKFKPNYETLKCDECGGTIGIYDRFTCYALGVEYSSSSPICNRCGKEFKLYELPYDCLYTNNKTSWIIPVVIRKESENG